MYYKNISLQSLKVYHFYSEIKKYLLYLGNISGDFSANNMKKNPELNGCVHDFSIDWRTFDTTTMVIIF